MGVLAVVCLCLTFSLATGLDCFKCFSVYSEATAGAVTTLLSSYTRSEACETADDPSALPQETCPTTSADGYVYACQKVSGKASWKCAFSSAFCTSEGVDYPIQGTRRGCMQVLTDQSDVCRETTDTSPFELNVPLTGSGELCNCDSSKCNGQTNLAPALFAFFISFAVALYASY